MTDDKKELPATRSQVPSILGNSGTMERRAALEEKLVRALAEAAQRVHDETGIRVDSATFAWVDRTVIGDVTRHMVKSVHIRTTVTTIIKDDRGLP